jgi:hypothetical protein
VRGEAAFQLLAEDHVSVGDDVELTLLTGNGFCLVGGLLVQLGRETRGPDVIAVSDRAVVDLDLHPAEPTEATGAHPRGVLLEARGPQDRPGRSR